MTTSRYPSTSTSSPTRARRPSRAMRNPPSVSYGPAGSANPQRSAKSVRLSRPSTSLGTPPSAGSGSGARSYSSVISPISSSIRSSRVTIPAVPPYSSTTTARCRPSLRISDSAGSTRLLAGSRLTSRASSPTVTAPSGSGRISRSRRCTKPTTSSCEPSMTGKRECRAARTAATALATGRLASRKTTSVRGTITSRTCRAPAASTSSMMCRSSPDSTMLAATRSRSSASEMDSRPAVALAPSIRVTQRARPSAARTTTGAKVPARPVPARSGMVRIVVVTGCTHRSCWKLLGSVECWAGTALHRVVKGGPVLAQQRQASILDRVRRNGGARVADLVRVLGVSDMTIRRDIEALAERGLVAKVHGGAIAIEGTTDEPGYAAKSGQQLAEKVAIARAAAELVNPGTAVGISAGTTTATLARELAGVPELTVVTNSIPVADVFYRTGRLDQTVVLTGGTRTPSDALVGPVAQEAAARINLDLLFLGVHGMSARAGYTTPNLSEADTNRALVAAARRLVVLADHTKWDMIGIATIAALGEAQVVVTDSGLPLEARAELGLSVDELIIAEVGPVELEWVR